MKLDLRETQPNVSVKLAGLLKGVAGEVEDHDPSSGLQDFVGCGQRTRRVRNMVQDLAENHEIHGLRVDRRILNIPEAVIDIFKSMVPGECGAEFDHLPGVVHGDHLFRRSREQLGQRPLARPHVGNHQRRQKPEERMRKRLPGPPGHVDPSEASSEFVEILGRTILALAHRQRESRQVARNLAHVSPRPRQNPADHRVGILPRGIKNILPHPAVDREPLALQLAETGRDP